MDLFADKFSAPAACLTDPRSAVSTRRELDPKCFCLAKEVLFRQYAKAAFDAGIDVSLIGEVAQAAEVVAGSVLKVATADPMWSPQDVMPLYQYPSPDVLACSGSFWKNAEFAGTHSVRLVHCWGDPYRS